MSELPTGTLTLFFTDVEGSTRFQQEVGEQYADHLADHHRIIRTALERHGGHEVDTQGEAFFAVFTQATGAAAAAADVQRAFAEHPFAVRIGLHTGQPRIAETGYVGLDVPRAARICAAAWGGQVLLSQTTHDLVDDTWATRDLGDHRLKDLIQPVRLYQLVGAGLTDAFPPPRTLESRPTNLPVQPTALVGRGVEVEAVSALILGDDVRLVTLTGAGGTGKTRIALQVAAEIVDDLADGAFFVGLETVTDPSLVLPAIAQATGAARAGAAGLENAMHDFLRTRELLLVLDNFEQLTPSAALLAELLAKAPRLRLLVTSREPLRLSAEREYPVPPLSLPELDRLPTPAALARYESVALFVERARAARPTFAITEQNAGAIAEICVRLDGLPLALELAAARIRSLTPEAMLTRLERRLDLLTGGARDLPARQRTLRAAIDWSYDLLEEPERVLLARLAVFAGGCSLEAAEAVCDATLDKLESLIEKSLVRQQGGADGGPRFMLLETIREYAAERLALLPDHTETRDRHLAFVREWFETRALDRLEDANLTEDYDRDEDEHENAQAALAYARECGDSEAELQLASAVRFLWLAHGYYDYGSRQLRDALDRARDAPAGRRAWALVGLCPMLWPQGKWNEAHRSAEQARDLFGELADDRGRAYAANALAVAYAGIGEGEKSRGLYDEAEALFRRLGERSGLGRVLNNRGYGLLVEGDLPAAERALREAREVNPAERWTVLNLALIALKRGAPDEAVQLYAETLRASRNAGRPQFVSYALEGVARVAALRGQDELAARLWGASEAMRERLNAPLQHVERETHDAAVAASRKRAGEQAHASAWAAGRAMPIDELVDQALELAG